MSSNEIIRRALPTRPKKIVIKIGSAVLVGDGLSVVDRPIFARLVAEIATLSRAGHQLLVVSSGAVALGRRLMGFTSRAGETLSKKQALAAIGQPALMELYSRELYFHGLQAAQILMTREDLDDRQRYLSFRETMRQLKLMEAAIPVLNENDTLSSEEIRFGDNDRLAALVAGAWDADLLIILSDVPGLCDEDPRINPNAQRISKLPADDPSLATLGGDASSSGVGTGGMRSKVEAAKIAGEQGVSTVIAPGRASDVLSKIIDGRDIGTLLQACAERTSKRKSWLRFASIPVGTLLVDDGAKRALIEKGGSLLAAGLREVSGDFLPGATVAIAGSDGQPFAHGLALFGADDCRRVIGKRSDELEEALGYSASPNVVHRDDLVLLSDGA